MGNLDIIKAGYDALMRGDMAMVLANFDENIEWHEAEGHPYNPKNEPWFGVDVVVEKLFNRIEAEWDELVSKPLKFYDAGDTIVVEGRYTGTYKPTGEAEDTQFCHIWTLRAGKVVRFQQYLDTAQLQRVMHT